MTDCICGNTVHWHVQDTLSQSQDKAFQRIAELREQIQLDHMAKVDVENNYRMLLEDKDELVKVLKTQVLWVVQEAGLENILIFSKIFPEISGNLLNNFVTL